jgi:hypothetical protein
MLASGEKSRLTHECSALRLKQFKTRLQEADWAFHASVCLFLLKPPIGMYKALAQQFYLNLNAPNDLFT